jgi:hypothetical protein
MATPTPAVKLHPALRDKRGTIPDLDFIKRRVPIADVARALDIRVVGNSAHCWRPESHENGDRTPSVWFSKKSNKGKCEVCDRWTWSNIDLVQSVLACTTALAISWIAERFNVPRIPKRRPRRNHVVVPAGRVGCGSPVQELMRSGVFAKLTHATKVLLFVLVEFCDHTEKLSYRTLQRVTGIGSPSTITDSLEILENIGLLKIRRGHGSDGLRVMNGYRLTWDDANLQRLMGDTHETTSREIAAEKELREGARAARAQYLGNTSLHSVKQAERSPLQPLKHSRNEGRGKQPQPETLRKGRKVTA